MKKSNLIFLIVGLIIILTATDGIAQKHPGKRGKQKQEVNHKKKKKPTPHYHYRHLPKRGAVITNFTRPAVIFTISGVKYHYSDGIYYRKITKGFKVVKAPKMLRIKKMPTGFITLKVNRVPFFYYFGTFYKQDNITKEYEVVTPPEGAVVNALPEGYETKQISNETFYVIDDVYYKKITDENGEVQYKVVSEN